MKKQILLVVLVLIAVLALVGCGSSATPVPQPTSPPVVITVIITATPQPVTATLPPPTITPVPTVGETKVAQGTDVAKSSASASSSSRPAATATRRATLVTPVVVPPTFTLVPNKYPAPSMIGPVFDESLGRKDSRSTGEDVVFNWHSVGALGTNECYTIRVDVAPGQGDQFLICDLAETQKGPGVEVRFVLWRPNRGSPNFSSLLTASPTAQTVSWYVTVVRDDGPGGTPAAGAFYATDGQRHKVTPLSPRSSTYSFPLNGGL
jgi:hypothetical protein